MIPAKSMSKNPLRKLHLLLLACVPLLSFLGMFIVHNEVFAASSPKDPQVVIAVDATNQGPIPCKLTLKANIGTPQEAKVTLPCPAGTIKRSTIVPRSQALKLHATYIPLSLSDASQTSDIQQLASMLSSQTSLTRVHPLTTACGNEGSAILTWGATEPITGEYFRATSTVTFYIPPSHCSQVVFETSTLADDVDYCTNPYSPRSAYPCFFWEGDKYAGAFYGLPLPASDYDWYLVQGTSYTHSIDLENTKGYTYEQLVKNFNTFWCDIPVN